MLRSFSTRANSFYDVVIVGGGLVGGAMACSIGRNPSFNSLKVLVLESGRTKTDDDDKVTPRNNKQYSNRVSAITPSSVKMFQKFGVWDHINQSGRAQPVSSLYVEDGCADSRIRFHQKDRYSPIAHIVENELIVRALNSCIKQRCANVVLKEGSTVKLLSVPENLSENVSIELDGGELIESSLVIAADGAKSFVRSIAGINFEETSYDQMSIVGTLAIDNNNNNSEKNQSIAWQKFMPFGPVALLPLSDELSSLVWTTSSEEVIRLLALSEDQFVDELNQTLTHNQRHHSQPINQFLGAVDRTFSCLLPSNEPKLQFPFVVALPYGDRAAFPLSFGRATSYVRTRVALIGDAAHRIHPLAGQGVNLGWSDVRFLTYALELAAAEGGDFGSLTYLREFDSKSQRSNVPKMVAIDALNRLYSTDTGPCVLMRSLGFNTLNRLLPAKDLIVHMAS